MHHGVELGARQVAVRIGTTRQCIQFILSVIARRDLGHDLLRQHIKRLGRDDQPVEFAALHAVEQRRALHQIVARHGEQPALWDTADRVVSAPDALQEGGDGMRAAQLADQIDVADVDAQFQRGGCDQCAQLAGLQALLRLQPLFFGQAAVVGADIFLSQAFAQMQRDALHLAARVGEHQGGVVGADQFGQPVVHLLPHLARHHRLERRARQFQREITLACVAAVNYYTVNFLLPLSPLGRGMGRGEEGAAADQKSRDLLDRLLRGRQTDARERMRARECRQTFERQGQMRAALAARDRMDFVHDHAARRRQHVAPGFAGEQQIQRLGSRDQNMRRALDHGRALAGRGVAGAHLHANVHVRQMERLQLRTNAGQRPLQVALDVVGQRLERRHVHHAGFVCEPACHAVAHQCVDCGEERRQRLARTGGRGDQRVPASANCRPGLGLRRRRRAEGRLEPASDGGMKGRERHAQSASASVIKRNSYSPLPLAGEGSGETTAWMQEVGQRRERLPRVQRICSNTLSNCCITSLFQKRSTV